MASSGEPPGTPPGVKTNATLTTTGLPDDASNIEAFVASATPVFIARGRRRAEESTSSSSSSSSYALKDLWASFVEPSAFGAEVPLRLQEGLDVSQYYVPFLSGMQLFTREAADGEDDTKEEDQGTAAAGSGRVRPGGTRLTFEFFEKASPYTRASLSDTIRGIMEEQPELAKLTSDDLAPSSWMSVAWYPIYRIPQGTMLHDVQGCFLTYHALYVGELRDGDIACPLPPKMSNLVERLIDERVTKARENASFGVFDGGDANDVDTDEKNASSSFTVRVLRPFGLSMYKMQGDVWAANETTTEWMNKLMDGAYTWLRMRKTVHPDYEFFSHFG